MKLCVPVRVVNGLESCIEPHLPNAEHLLIIDTETRELQHVSLRDQPAASQKSDRPGKPRRKVQVMHHRKHAATCAGKVMGQLHHLQLVADIQRGHGLIA